MRKCCSKNAKEAYNNTAQTVTEAATTIAVLGNMATDCGCSITTTPNGFKTNAKGLYRISYDVVFTPTAAGDVVLSFNADGMALPCVNTTATTTADNVTTLHAETIICIEPCVTVYATIAGVAGTINHVCASMIKM